MIYAARPTWKTGGSFPRWAIPEWAANFRDLRTFDDCGVAGSRDGDRSGLGLYIPREGVTVKDAAAIPLGELDDVLTGEQKTALNVSEIRTLREAIVQRILFSDSPPTLMRGGKVEIGIGPQRIIVPMAPGTDGFDIVQAKMKASLLASPTEKYGALITDRLEKLGVAVTRENASIYLGLDMEPGPKQTTKGDTFNRATDVLISSHTPTGANAGTSWSSIAGGIRVDNNGATGRAYASGGGGTARMNDDMSSADIEASFNVQFLTAITGRFAGAVIRKDSSATATFMAGLFSPDRSPAKYVIAKSVTGTYSDLATANGTFVADTYKNIKLRGVGGDFTLYEAGVSVLTVTDSSVPGGLRGGMTGGSGGGSNYITMQQFLVTDELGGAVAFPDRHFPRGILRGVTRGLV